MGRYTILNDPRVDEYIDNFLKRLVETLLRSVSNVRSIILAGSFGKGEGSVLVDDQGVKPLRDFDIVLVFEDKPPPVESTKNLQEKLQNEFSTFKAHDKYYLINDLIPEIKPTTLENINSLPDIFTYDLKHCQVLYGEDIRSQIQWDIKDLPLRTNARALLQKATALVGVFHGSYLNEGIPIHLKESFLRETSRAYIEICVGLCLLAKRYHWSSVNRLETLREIYRKRFANLYEKIPDLIEKIEASTRFKLDPANNVIDVDPLNYWFETRDDLGEVLKYYFGEYLNISFYNWIQFANSLERHLTNAYYLPVIQAFLRNRSLPENRSIVKIVNIIFNVKENIDYSRTAIKAGRLSLPLLRGTSSPAIKVLSVTPLVLFSINEDGSVDSEYLGVASRRLEFVKRRINNSGYTWDKTRSKFLELVFSVNMI